MSIVLRLSQTMHSRLAEMATATSSSLSGVITELLEKALVTEHQSAGPPLSEGNLADIRRECEHIDAALTDVRRQLSMLAIRSRAFPSFALDDPEVDSADSITWLPDVDDPEPVDDMGYIDRGTAGAPVDPTEFEAEVDGADPPGTVAQPAFRGWPPPDPVKERSLREILSTFYD